MMREWERTLNGGLRYVAGAVETGEFGVPWGAGVLRALKVGGGGGVQAGRIASHRKSQAQSSKQSDQSQRKKAAQRPGPC